MIRQALRPIGSARTTIVLACVALTAACSSAPPAPAALDTKNDACGHCRMTVSDRRFAAQIVTPGEEPRFFDDLGCLRAYLEGARPLDGGAAVFVASFATGTWVDARSAVYTRHASIGTPMGFGYIAFANAAERAASLKAPGGMPLSTSDVFGNRLPGGSER